MTGTGHHETGRDTDAHPEPGRLALGNMQLAGQHFDDFQPRVYGPLCIVLVRRRIPEQRQQSVAHIAGNVTFVALNCVRAGALECAQNISQIFGIESLRQRRRFHEVTEHHGEVAALRFTSL